MKISNFSLDWLSFTYFGNKTGDLISDFFSDFPELEPIKDQFILTTGQKYSNSLYLDEYMQIFFDDDPDTGKGVNVRISSHGLGRFFEFFKTDSVPLLFSLLKSRNCRPSRLDIAFDDYTKKYSPRYYAHKFENGKLFTRMKSHAYFTDPVTGGKTFYLGSRRKKMIRIYEKYKESDGEIDAIRYEIEMHANAAISFFNYLIYTDNEDVITFGNLLYDCFRVVNPNYNDQNKSRWPINMRWLAFMESQVLRRDSIKIPVYKPEVIVKKIEKWVKTECFGTLLFFQMLYGKSWVNEQLKNVNLPQKYKLLLRDLRADWFSYENFEDYYNRLFFV